ncbi:hypothetical protein GF1_16000 [Desulfolithobacter dissulfuricans]|uniref:Uncharacterized protein n=1 Tax=Desulfolithobacter dissulfuricans TaxID=2795293 RepID=A0A915U0I6_9BACT|nr:hypothetical protein GF1_16000 [Desulfolithobacter dissulfuricans]
MDRSDWNPSEVTDKEHPEINTGRNGRVSTLGNIWGALLLKPCIETIFLEKLVQAGIKKVSAPGR